MCCLFGDFGAVIALGSCRHYDATNKELTVDANYFDHSEGEEGHRGHFHFDKHCCQQKDHQNDRQTA